MPERSTYLWYSPTDAAARHDLARRLRDAGCERVWLKAGGDDGFAWAPSQPNPPRWLVPQWDRRHLIDYSAAGLDVLPWFYVWPTPNDQEAIVRALRWCMARTIALNPETEWRVQSPENPFRNLGQANAAARAWVATLRERLRTEFGGDFAIGFSGVPSWADFPYEGFVEACDFAHPQDYWPDNAMADDGEAGEEAGEDQVEAHLRRAGRAENCVPILAASRELDDDGVVALAENALRDHPDLDGFSAWEASNAAFQLDAMRRAWALLPDDAAPVATAGDSPMIRAIRELLGIT